MRVSVSSLVLVLCPPSTLGLQLAAARRPTLHAALRPPLRAPVRAPPPRAGLLQQGVAGVVAYTCVSSAWYAVGVSLCLLGLPDATVQQPALLRQALGRVGKAYAITFAASQLSAPWRAATAAAMLPLAARVLSAVRTQFGLSGASLVPAALVFAAAAAVFAAVMAALVGRELAMLRGLPQAAAEDAAEASEPDKTAVHQ